MIMKQMNNLNKMKWQIKTQSLKHILDFILVVSVMRVGNVLMILYYYQIQNKYQCLKLYGFLNANRTDRQ